MACFPRLFHRHKNSFNPAEDDNDDTILNNDDNAVQIGRYIRREETPVFTPKNSERTAQRQQQKLAAAQHQQQQQPNHNSNSGSAVNNNNNNNNNNNTSSSSSNTVNNNISSNSISNITITYSNSNSSSNNSSNSINNNSSNNNNTSSNNNISTNNNISSNNSTSSNNINSNNNYKSNSTGRKFISKKSNGVYANNQGNSNNNNNNSSSSTFTKTTTVSVANSVNSKFKPVKERRPTALPSDVPHIEEDVLDGTPGTIRYFELNGDGASAGSVPTTPDTPSNTPTNVKFYLAQEDDETQSGDAASVAAAFKLSSTDGKALNGSASYTSSRQQSLKSLQLVPNYTAIKTTTTTATEAATSHTPTSTTTTTTGLQLKLPSNTSNKVRKGAASPRVLDPHEQQEPLVYIPPAPPLPPQPLTTANSSVSLASLKSAKALKRNSSYSNSHSNDPKTHSKHGSNVDTDAKDQTPTPSPKDSENSDTPKSHRLEGGLIFTRHNLPIKQDVQIEYIKKNEDTRELIRAAIEDNAFLNNYMDKERKEMVIDAMEPANYEKNHYIINENDEGSEIYVSEDGEYEVLKDHKVVHSFGGGTVFGELAILYNAKRLASVRAATYARVWKIEREKFRKIMVISGSMEREEKLNFLRSAPFLSDLEVKLLDKVVDLLQRKFYETNTCIVREGEVGNEFFIVRAGTVTIKKLDGEGVEHVVARRKRGDYFGEQALLNADRRQASVYADAPGTEVLKLDREAFISYLGTIPELHAKPDERLSSETRVSHRKSEFDNEYANIDLKELKKIATLGAGAFGRVDLVSHGQKTFALKIIKKIDIVKQDQVDHVYSEKHVMMKCRSSPFIIELYKTFRNEKFVYFLMEACMGGDVWTVMSQRRLFDEKTAKFLAGCVVEAFDFLHSHNIIYRDLKPENLMLTTDGYCKLVDFGFAKHIPPNQKTNTFAGTPEYVAPEIILDRGHDRAVDYWALGILIFELLVGRTPFRGQNQIKIYQQILGGIDVIQMPSKIPKSAQGLIKHLCKQLPAERLGYQRRGIQDIKKHSWFDNLDWNKLKNKQLTSPIKRPIASNTDLQYFGPTGVENDHDPPDETSGWDIDF